MVKRTGGEGTDQGITLVTPDLKIRSAGFQARGDSGSIPSGCVV